MDDITSVQTSIDRNADMVGMHEDDVRTVIEGNVENGIVDSEALNEFDRALEDFWAAVSAVDNAAEDARLAIEDALRDGEIDLDENEAIIQAIADFNSAVTAYNEAFRELEAAAEVGKNGRSI